ncbi:MAG TPA: hypothetical protein VFH80_19480 [Solirubrobacteraceae bacterium]|nr:hypothetical protein [Solirubrobacteraceae bacterium]
MSEQPVTIREHIHQALLAAGPVGLTMAALAEAIVGPWSARDVQDTVRRLWDVGELARRQDGTFVLSERTAGETRQTDRELDEAVRRVAERARRASHQTEVRVRRVDPALLRAFCPTCHTQVLPRLDGRCPACGTQTGANLEAAEPASRAPRRRKPLRKGQAGWGPNCPRCGGPKGLQAHMCSSCRKRQRGGYNRGRSGGGRPVHITEDLLAEARRMYAGGLSLRQVAAELHPRTGYKTVASCAEALYGHFKRRGWKLRPQREVTAARNYRHGRKSRTQTREQQNAYRRWLAEQRGWQAVQGPGRPLCKGVKQNPPGKGRPCRRHALTDSEYCYSHDPRRALERQAGTRQRRASGSGAAPTLARAA